MKITKQEAHPEPPPIEYVITLSEDEAAKLLRIAGCIGHPLAASIFTAASRHGNEFDGPSYETNGVRTFLSDVYKSLRDAGLGVI